MHLHSTEISLLGDGLSIRQCVFHNHLASVSFSHSHFSEVTERGSQSCHLSARHGPLLCNSRENIPRSGRMRVSMGVAKEWDVPSMEFAPKMFWKLLQRAQVHKMGIACATQWFTQIIHSLSSTDFSKREERFCEQRKEQSVPLPLKNEIQNVNRNHLPCNTVRC